MIDILAKIGIYNDTVTMSGKVFQEKKKIELNCHLSDFPSAIFNQSILYGMKSTATFVDTESKHYTAYGVSFYKTEMSLMNNGVLTLFGSFNRLVREFEPTQNFVAVCFSFNGIEQLFHYERFESDRSRERLSFYKNETSKIEQKLMDNVTCFVESLFHGVYASTHLYHLNLKQDKKISVFSKNPLSMDEWIGIVRRIKHYFEFVLNQEIQIRDVSLLVDAKRLDKKTILIADEIITAKTFVKDIDEKPYRGTEQELLEGLAGWMNHYDEYKRVIDIWLKTIYNLNVEDEDRFIWEAQAFEVFCETHKDIFLQAEKLKVPGQSFPNLRNYLDTIQEIYTFDNAFESYYKDVKDVRNYYTHNNPNFEVSERQKTNSYKLIHYFLRKSIAKEFGISNLKSSFFLIPPEKIEKQ